MNQQSTSTHQETSPLVPIDSKAIVEHGGSPTAIILAITILISILVNSITKLVRIIVVTKSSR